MSLSAARIAVVLTLSSGLAAACPGLVAPAEGAVAQPERSTQSARSFGPKVRGSLKPLPANMKRVSGHALPERGLVTHLSAYVDGKGRGKGQAQRLRLVLYADRKGAPAGLLAATRTHRVRKGAAGRWITLPVTSPTLLTPGRYHLGIHSGPRQRVARYGILTGTAARRQNRDSFRTGPSRAFGKARRSSGTVAVRAEYVPAAGTPLALPGLRLWLRADAGVATARSNVRAWTDQSGFGANAGQSTPSARPQLLRKGLNGRPAIRFDGVNDFMTFTLPLNNLPELTLVLVAANASDRDGGPSGVQNAPLFWNETTSWGTVHLSPFQSRVKYRFGTTEEGNLPSWTRPAPVSEASLAIATKRGATETLHVDGALVLSQTGKRPSIQGVRSIGNLGRGFNDNTFFPGTIAEVLVFTRALGDSDRRQLEAYLQDKYGLSGGGTTGTTDTSPPSTPEAVATSGETQTSVSLSWSPSTDDVGVAGYRLYRNGTQVASTQALSHTFAGLSCGTSYTLGVEAYDAAGNVSGRATTNAATAACSPSPAPPAPPPPPDTEPPSQPTNQQIASVTQTTITMTWEPATDNVGVTGYNVYLDNAYVATTAALLYVYSGLSCGTTYTVALEARDAAGNVSDRRYATGPATTAACDGPPPSPPPPPPPPPAPPPPPPPPGEGTANIWVHAAGGGTCIRSATPTTYSAATACSSLQAAYAAANTSSAESVVLVRGGTYGGQQITGNRSSTSRILIEPAPGETVVYAGKIQIGQAGSIVGPDYLTLRGLVTTQVGSGYETPENRWGMSIHPGSTSIEIYNGRTGNAAVFGATDVLVKNSELGPCRASTLDSIPGSGPCTINYIDFGEGRRPTNITFDGVYIHDYNYAPSAVSAGNVHYRPLYGNGVNGLTIRNSTFANNVFEPWTTISGSDAGTWGNHNILIENNQFGRSVQTPSGTNGGFGFAWCQNYKGADVAYRNVTVRFNSFAAGVLTGVPDTVASTGTCRISDFRLYGNIMRYPSSCGISGPGTGIGTATWGYNVFTGSTNRTCGPGDVYIGGSSHPFYANDTLAPSPGDFRLTGPLFAGDNLVPITQGCPAASAAGVLRPQNPGFCDAGAHERAG